MNVTNQKNIIIVGGGYAGIHFIEGLKKQLKTQINENIKILLIDKNSYHFQKVKLFKAITEETTNNLCIPLTAFCEPGIDFIQGELEKVNPLKQFITLKTNCGEHVELPYHHLILTLGSIPREVNPELGGRTLNSLYSAKAIRKDLLHMIQESRQHLKIALVGGGITGIETAAEINSWLKQIPTTSPKKIEVFLLNEKNRLLEDAPIKVSQQLENRLAKLGIRLINGRRVTSFQTNQIHFGEGPPLEVNYCIWTIGQTPHPALQELGFPLSKEGRLLTDSWYRLLNQTNIYAIGDCVHIVDPTTGEMAGMTCKEAISQAQRLAKIIKADLQGQNANAHENVVNQFCIGLGPNDGFAWTQKWGIDFVLSGKLGAKIRDYTWNLASLNHK
jgi:NADH:ubiquinone reductase (H+-translocating)